MFLFHRKADHSKAKKLPQVVREYMRYRFILLPEYLAMLRCFEYTGMVKGKQVRRIHIFSPNRAFESYLAINSDQDLMQHPEMLLFEGHIDSQGKVYVADRRPPLRMLKAR